MQGFDDHQGNLKNHECDKCAQINAADQRQKAPQGLQKWLTQFAHQDEQWRMGLHQTQQRINDDQTHQATDGE